MLLPLKTQLLLKNSRLSAKYVLRLSNLVWLLPVKYLEQKLNSAEDEKLAGSVVDKYEIILICVP